MKTESFELLSDQIRNEADAPKGADIYYRCGKCASVIPSQPDDNMGCECCNIFIDIDYFRLVVRDFATFEVVRKM